MFGEAYYKLSGPRDARLATFIYQGRSVRVPFSGRTPWEALRRRLHKTGRAADPTEANARRQLMYGRFDFAKRRAEKKGMPFTITLDDLFAMGNAQRWRCAVSGIRFVFDGAGKWRNPYAPSIDRIDCSRGYELDNIRIVLVAVNCAMGSWGEEPLVKIASAIHRRSMRKYRGAVTLTS